MVIPIVIYGMRALERLQFWTTPLWLALALLPLLWVIVSDPDAVSAFVAFTGESDGAVSFEAIVASAAVCFALTPQLAEQIDVIRAMPPRTRANRRSWWASLLFAGPGWVLFSGIKQVIGVFLAVYLITRVDPGLGQQAAEPVRQFIALYESIMPEWLAIGLALVLVVVAQVKINVTNAYSGSLAWSNVYTRLTKTYPGRSVFIFFNLAIALALMWMDVFSLISFVLSLYANVVMAWLVTIAADIAINKHVLRISPIYPGIPPRDAARLESGRPRVGGPGVAPVAGGVRGPVRRGAAAVLGADRHRRRRDHDPAHGAGHARQVLPATPDGRHRLADPRCRRQPVG